MNKIFVKRLTDRSHIPTKSHDSDAGWDLYSSEDVVIQVGDTITISTDITFAIPSGYAGLIWDRSSLGSKGIHRHAGVIDAAYRGPVKVCLHNSSGNLYSVKKGDRIAQVIFQEIKPFELEVVDDLSSTQRGDGGFGSTGK
jgi:dUTP pyrophosphatase